MLQIVQECRGTWHVCAAYIDGTFAVCWAEHPDEGEAVEELRALAVGHVVTPLLFVPRKFEDWYLGDKIDGEDGPSLVWPRKFAALDGEFVEVSRDEDGWPFGLPYDWLALASLFGPIADD
jgi:hypothetical protein